MSEAQKYRVRALARQGGLLESEVEEIAEKLTGHTVSSLDDLDTRELSDLIDHLQDGRT